MKDVIPALIGGVIGAVTPIVITASTAWLERRDVRKQQAYVLESAGRQVDFLQACFKLQKDLLADGKLATLRQDLASQVDIIRETAFVPVVRPRSVLQKLLLTYKPHRAMGWVYRILYYMSLGVIFAIIADGIMSRTLFTGIDDSTGEFSVGYLFGEFIGVSLTFIVPLVIWILAERSERKARVKKAAIAAAAVPSEAV